MITSKYFDWLDDYGNLAIDQQNVVTCASIIGKIYSSAK